MASRSGDCVDKNNKTGIEKDWKAPCFLSTYKTEWNTLFFSYLHKSHVDLVTTKVCWGREKGRGKRVEERGGGN